MSSQPAARPFLSFFTALTTSSNVGSSVHISMSGVADEEAALSSGHTVPVECLIIVFTTSFENFFNSRALRALRSVYWGLKAREVISNDYSHRPENRTDLASTCIHFSFRGNVVKEDILVMSSHPLEPSLQAPSLCVISPQYCSALLLQDIAATITKVTVQILQHYCMDCKK